MWKMDGMGHRVRSKRPHCPITALLYGLDSNISILFLQETQFHVNDAVVMLTDNGHI